MKIGVKIKINVNNIDKSQMFKGQKGTYLDAVAFIDIDNVGQYGDNGMVTQDIQKEMKDQGMKGAILGNATVFWNDSQPVAQAQQQQAPQQQYQAAPQQQQHQQAPQHQYQPSPNQHTPNAQKFNQQQQPAPNFDNFDDDVPF